MRRRAGELGAIVLGAALCCVPTGCYHHVVGAEGVGTGVDEVYEPNVGKDPDAIDSLLWGDPPPPKKTTKKKR